MSTRSQYKTKQREALFSYFASIPGQHFTVSDVCAYFRAQGCPIGMTTVYRQLDRMVDEGLVNKYIIDANTPACFEYIGEASHCTEETCFHCKCEKCGVLITFTVRNSKASAHTLWNIIVLYSIRSVPFSTASAKNARAHPAALRKGSMHKT